MTFTHWFEQLSAGDLSYIFDLNCYWSYHSNLIISLLINQPFVTAITLIGYGPRCPLTSEKSRLTIVQTNKKKTDLQWSCDSEKIQLEITTDQLENCENRSRPKLLGDRRLIRQRSAKIEAGQHN